MSKDDDKKNYASIENQRLIIQQYGKEQGVEIQNWYEDDGVSGYLFERPAFQRMLEDLKKGKLDMVIVKDFSRLGRHNAKVLLLLDELTELGKRLIAIDDNYDSQEPDDGIIGIKTWYNERYVKDTSKKIRKVLSARQKEGSLLTPVPFGYKRNREDKKKIEVVAEEARLVRKIFDLYIQGLGYRKIKEFLNENNTPTPSMARRMRELSEGKVSKRKVAYEWTDGMVKDILDNDFYIGTFRLHKRARAVVHGKDKRIKKEDQYAFLGHHSPVVAEETYQMVQSIKEKRSQTHYRGGRIRNEEGEIEAPLFGGCLSCKDCGKRMVQIRRQTGKGSRKYYICNTYNTKGSQYCKKSHLIEEESLICDFMAYLRLCLDVLSSTAAYKEKHMEKKKQPDQEDFQRLSGNLIKKKNQLKMLLGQKVKELTENPGMEEILHESYEEVQNQLLKQIREIERKLFQAEHSFEKRENAQKEKQTAFGMADEIIQKNQINRKIVEFLIEEITINEKGEPEFFFRYALLPGPFQSLSQKMNQREDETIEYIQKLILEEERGYTSKRALSNSLAKAGFLKSPAAVTPYINMMIDRGILKPEENNRRPYRIFLHGSMADRRNAGDGI